MGIADHLSDADVMLDLGVTTKGCRAAPACRRSRRAPAPSRGEVLDALQARETLGSTALGRGVALPHARLAGDCAPVVVFARLHRPIDFDARDEEPVDLVIAVLWPMPSRKDSCRCSRRPAARCATRARCGSCARRRTPRDVLGVLAASGTAGPP